MLTRRHLVRRATLWPFLPLAAGPAAAQAETHFLRIATGSVSGTYYPIAGLIAGIISQPPGARGCPCRRDLRRARPDRNRPVLGRLGCQCPRHPDRCGRGRLCPERCGFRRLPCHRRVRRRAAGPPAAPARKPLYGERPSRGRSCLGDSPAGRPRRQAGLDRHQRLGQPHRCPADPRGLRAGAE